MGILTVVLSIIFWSILPATRHSSIRELAWKSILPAYRMPLTNKKLMVLIFLPFLLMGVFVMLYNYIGFLLMEPPYNLSQTFIGILFIVYLAGTFSSIYMGKKADQHGRSFILKLSIGLMISGAIGTLLPNLLIKIMGMAIFTFGFFASHSIIGAWVGNDAEDSKAQASSLYFLFYYLGSSLIGSLGGFFWTHFHWIGVVSLIVFLLMICYPLILCSQKEQRWLQITKP